MQSGITRIIFRETYKDEAGILLLLNNNKEDFEEKHEKLLEAQEVIDKNKKLQEDAVRELTRKLKSIDKSISNIEELEDERDNLDNSIDSKIINIFRQTKSIKRGHKVKKS